MDYSCEAKSQHNLHFVIHNLMIPGPIEHIKANTLKFHHSILCDVVNIQEFEINMFPIPQSNKVLLYREPSGRVHSLLPLTVRCRSHSEAAGPTPPLPPPRTVGAGSSLPQTCSSESTKQSISLPTSNFKQISNIILWSKSCKY